MMEHVCGHLAKKRVALFSNNSPTVSLIQRMASRASLIAEQLIRILALHFNTNKVCPITTLHIAGDQNSMTDISSCLFGSEQKWHFQSELNFLTFFNKSFPLPCQNSWTLYQPTSAIATGVISILRMKPFTLEDWRQLPMARKNIGTTGRLMQSLWEWTLTYRTPPSPSGFAYSPDSPQESKKATTAMETKSKIAQSVAQLRPLARQLRWPVIPTQQK
jgi:hypothetical protein